MDTAQQRSLRCLQFDSPPTKYYVLFNMNQFSLSILFWGIELSSKGKWGGGGCFVDYIGYTVIRKTMNLHSQCCFVLLFNKNPINIFFTVICKIDLKFCQKILKYRKKTFLSYALWRKPKKVFLDLQRRRLYFASLSLLICLCSRLPPTPCVL